ncbi:MAG TPA: cbb3-type cytochrome oxidase assembly protein CcoS [Hyphomicrobiales bacterium]|nr:cbb3-type cytochrome oxidase assembly protein CcoS [Hyphomicrobiales bacterium]
MSILVVMVPLSILLLIGAGVAFFWAVDHDQFDDMDTPSLLPLEDAPVDAQQTNVPTRAPATDKTP